MPPPFNQSSVCVRYSSVFRRGGSSTPYRHNMTTADNTITCNHCTNTTIQAEYNHDRHGSNSPHPGEHIHGIVSPFTQQQPSGTPIQTQIYRHNAASTDTTHTAHTRKHIHDTVSPLHYHGRHKHLYKRKCHQPFTITTIQTQCR